MLNFFKKKKRKKFDLDRVLEETDSTTLIISIDTYLNDLSEYGDRVDRLTQPQRVFLFVENLEREVNNGGFNQFYFNSSGDFAVETLAALKTIEANKTAAILARANSQFPSGAIPKDRSERIELLLQVQDEAEKVWKNCNQEFFRYQEKIELLLIEYVKANRDYFRN